MARRLTLTSCCGESFCQACIADIQEHGQPCPECETNEFTFFEHGKKSKKNPLLKSLLQHEREWVCLVWDTGPVGHSLIDTHLDCGVSGKHEVIEDHMEIWHLEEEECEFSGVRYDSRFNREDQDEHARQNGPKLLTLTASLAVETACSVENIKNNFKIKIEKQKCRIQEQEKVLWKQEKKLGELEKKLGEQQLVLS